MAGSQAVAPLPLHEALQRWAERLERGGSEEAALEARLIAAHLLGVSQTELALRLHEPVSQELMAEAERILAARGRHVPLQYLFGESHFFGLRLGCDARALVPRPETEVLVETALEETSRRERPGLLLDVGTGSGCVACAFAAERPGWPVVATDVSAQALALARENARALGLAQQIIFLQGDLLAPVQEAGLAWQVTDVVANLPYVSEAQYAGAQPELHHEPRRALVAGPTGLEAIERLLQQLPLLPKLNFAALEIGFNQRRAAVNAAKAALPGWDIEVRPDLAGLDRVLVARRDSAGR